MDQNTEIENRIRAFASGDTSKYDSKKAPSTKRILILEDDLLTLSTLIKDLHDLEEEFYDQKVGLDFAVTVLSEYTQVEEYVNKAKNIEFDIILLDRDCKACGSFHCLDIESIGADKIISISAIPQWNKEAVGRGVRKVVLKTHENIEKFSGRVMSEVRRMIL